MQSPVTRQAWQTFVHALLGNVQSRPVDASGQLATFLPYRCLKFVINFTYGFRLGLIDAKLIIYTKFTGRSTIAAAERCAEQVGI